MKSLIIFISLIASMSTFATASFECTTSNGETTIIGHIGAGNTLLDEVLIIDQRIEGTPTLIATMKWIDYKSNELKIASYDTSNDKLRLKLDTKDGLGTLAIDLSDIEGSIEYKLVETSVMCDF